MKNLSHSLAGGLIATALIGAPATAGDWNNGAGGIKDYGNAAVPVPVPVPVLEAFTYYIRADVGYTAASSGTISSTGSALPVNSPSELDGPWVVSGAVGRQLGPNSRLEVALAVRTQQRIANASTTYLQNRTVTGAPITNAFGVTTQTYDTGTYSVNRAEETQAKHHDLMLNYFYDIKGVSSRFTPYVGAGAGIVMHQMARKAHEDATCIAASNTVTGAYPFGICPTTLPAGYSTDASLNRIGYGLGANLMAGVAVQLSPHTYWDTGYRMMWSSGKVATTTGTVVGTSTVSIGSTVGHEIRTGFRWDIW